MKRIATIAAALTLIGSFAQAEITTDDVIADLSSKGYTRIEIKNGVTQIKVEAIRDGEKYEAIYDIATGAVLKSETGRVGLFENSNAGVSVRDAGRDFLKESGSGLEDDDEGDDVGDDASDDSSDDGNDDASDDSSDDSDDDGNDDSKDDHSDDDHGDDDHGDDSGDDGSDD